MNSSFKSNQKSKNPDVISLSTVRKSSLDIQFILAAESLGIKSGDIVWQDEEAVGLIVNNSGRVFRSSVLDLLRKKNVNVCLGTTIDKLNITNEGQINQYQLIMVHLMVPFLFWLEAWRDPATYYGK